MATAQPCTYAERLQSVRLQSVRALWRDEKPQADFGAGDACHFLQPLSASGIYSSQCQAPLFWESRRLLKGGRTMAVREKLRKKEPSASFLPVFARQKTRCLSKRGAPPQKKFCGKEDHKKMYDAARLFRASSAVVSFWARAAACPRALLRHVMINTTRPRRNARADDQNRLQLSDARLSCVF